MAFTSTRTRLIAIVTLVLVAGFVATNLVNYQISRQTLRANVLETELPLTGDNIYSEIQIDLVRPIFVSSLMANDTFLHDWVKQGEEDPAQVRRYLQAIKDRYDTFTAFFISEETRRYYHFTGVPQVVSSEDPEDVWYFRARSMEQPYEINVDPNQAQNNAITIFINYRVVDQAGRFLGITGVGLELDAVAKIIERYREAFERTVYFTDANGLVTVHPDPEIAYSRQLRELEGLGPIAERILSEERGAYQVERGEHTILMTTRYIPELDWWLVVEADEAEAIGDLQGGFLSNFLIGLAAIIVTLIAVTLAINRYQRRLETIATTDTLTGLANRQMFDDQLHRALNRARRSGRPLSLVIIDLDRFKTVNDRHGHLAGDQVLKRVAGIAGEAVRKSDILARWGGEEFALLMEECPREQAERIAETLRQRIAAADLRDILGAAAETNAANEDDAILPLTASFGVASMQPGAAGASDPDAEVERLLGEADRALYRAKADGRNRVAAA
jgi:diguanylate cyclase (GGDEF)-like protein